MFPTDLAGIGSQKHTGMNLFDVTFQLLRILHRDQAHSAGNADFVSMEGQHVHFQFKLILNGVTAEVADIGIRMISWGEQ